MPSERARRVDALTEIVRRVDAITLAMGALSFEEFAADITVDAAVHHHILIIGEAARRIDDVERLLPGHDWRAIKQFGNVIRHRYEDVQPRIAFELFRSGELARLRQDCTDAIQRVVHGRD